MIMIIMTVFCLYVYLYKPQDETERDGASLCFLY